MDFETAVINAIAQQFFTSQPIYTTPDGQIQWGPAPALNTVNALYDRRKESILAAVLEKVDINALADKIAEKVIADLRTIPPREAYLGSREANLAVQFQKDVREAVIDKIAEAQAKELRAKLEEPEG